MNAYADWQGLGKGWTMINDSESLVEVICWMVTIAAFTALIVNGLLHAQWDKLLP